MYCRGIKCSNSHTWHFLSRTKERSVCIFYGVRKLISLSIRISDFFFSLISIKFVMCSSTIYTGILERNNDQLYLVIVLIMHYVETVFIFLIQNLLQLIFNQGCFVSFCHIFPKEFPLEPELGCFLPVHFLDTLCFVNINAFKSLPCCFSSVLCTSVIL